MKIKTVWLMEKTGNGIKMTNIQYLPKVKIRENAIYEWRLGGDN